MASRNASIDPSIQKKSHVRNLATPTETPPPIARQVQHQGLPGLGGGVSRLEPPKKSRKKSSPSPQTSEKSLEESPKSLKKPVFGLFRDFTDCRRDFFQTCGARGSEDFFRDFFQTFGVWARRVLLPGRGDPKCSNTLVALRFLWYRRLSLLHPPLLSVIVAYRNPKTDLTRGGIARKSCL